MLRYLLMEYGKLIGIGIVACILMRFVSSKARIWMFPYVFGLLITVSIISVFSTTPVISYSAMAVIYLCASFLLLPAPLNMAERWFLFFWAYNVFVNYYTPYLAVGLKAKVWALFLYFGVGTMAGIYCARHRLLQRLAKVVALMSLVIVFWYDRTLIQEMDVSLDERIGSEIINPNLVGLYMVTILPFILLTLAYFRNTLRARVLAGVALFMCCWILFATGSRNAFIGASACLLGVIMLKTRRRWLKVALIGCVIIVFLWYLAQHTIVTESRVLDFRNDSGRIEHWQSLLSGRTLSQNLFGSGTLYDVGFSEIRTANGHSIFIQIYYEMGCLGVLLFLCYLIAHYLCARKNRLYGGISLMLLCTALASGFGESYPMAGNSLLALIWGLSMGLLSICRRSTPDRLQNSEER